MHHAKPRLTLVRMACFYAVVGTVFLLPYFYALEWWRIGELPFILTRTAENPDILPWYWTATNVSAAAAHYEYLCYIDIDATFVPMGEMDTGRRTLSAVMAYKPIKTFLWQCPQGTIVEMDEASLRHARQERDALQHHAKAAHALSQRARAVTKE